MLRSLGEAIADRVGVPSIVNSAAKYWFVTKAGSYPPFCNTKAFSVAKMDVHVVSALSDNYMYLLMDRSTKKCAAVDPVEPEKLVPLLKSIGGTLDCILTTHHHFDHAGGNNKMKDLFPDVSIYGGCERIEGVTNIVKHDDEVSFGSIKSKCLFTPCHTQSHICYYFAGNDGEDPCVFTGDTLFVSGCGKFFEGTPAEMYKALISVLANLPGSTRVFCGHEYTIQNLKFAQHVEPDNADIATRVQWAEELRSRNDPTVPSTIADELKCNPFMRVDDESLRSSFASVIASAGDGIAVMAALREAKNRFK